MEERVVMSLRRVCKYNYNAFSPILSTKKRSFATKAIKRRYNLSKNCCLYKIMNMYYNIASSWGSCMCRSLLLGIGVCWSHSPIPSYRKPMLNVKIQFLRFLCTILCNFWQIMSIYFFKKPNLYQKGNIIRRCHTLFRKSYRSPQNPVLRYCVSSDSHYSPISQISG